MNEFARRLMRERRERHSDHRDHHGGEYRGSMQYKGDYRMYDERDHRGRDMDYRRDHERDREEDYRYDHRRDHRHEYDDDYRRDHYHDHPVHDYMGEEDHLSHEDMRKWSHKLQNADKTTGAHFTDEQISRAANQMGVSFNGFTMTDLIMAANMLYSDFCEVLKSCVSKEKEAMVYTGLAKAFLMDEDGLRGSEKLSVYYMCIVEDDD